MKTTKTSNRDSQEYVIAFRVYVQADGGLAVAYGNQKLSMSGDEVHALLMGTLEYAKVFSKLKEQLDSTTLEIASQNGHVDTVI